MQNKKREFNLLIMPFTQSNLTLSLTPTGGAFRKRNSSLALCVLFCSAAPGYLTSKVMQNKTENQKNIFYIDEVTITGDKVAVDYTLNDEWESPELSLIVLTA